MTTNNNDNTTQTFPSFDRKGRPVNVTVPTDEIQGPAPKVERIDGDLESFVRTQSQRKALDKFVSTVGEIDDLLSTIKSATDDHFGFNPDAINWGHVGNVVEIRRRLAEIVSSL